MFFLIDKPIGISSFDVIRKLRKMLGIKKIGYVGTLDPLASGCLLIATHNSTKLVPLLEKSEKTYLFTVDISGKTASLDLGTELEPTSLHGLQARSPEELYTFILSQTTQIPPRYSALHINGSRAYALARDNKEFELRQREITLKDLEIIEFQPPIFTIRMRISSGGYIRSFAPLIGDFFGVSGGYIRMLRREKLHLPSGDLTLNESQGLEDFSLDSAIPYEKLFASFPIESITQEEYQDLLNGKVIPAKNRGYHHGQNILLRYENNFTSLVVFENESFKIIKNDV